MSKSISLSHFIEEIENEIKWVMENKSSTKPFKYKGELKVYLKQNHKLNKEYIDGAIEHFSRIYKLKR